MNGPNLFSVMDETKRLILKPGRERSLLRRHPWVFSGAVARVEGDVQSGDTVLVVKADGQPLGRGAYSAHSQIRTRMWTWDPDEPIDAGFFERKLQAAIKSRQRFSALLDSNAVRLVHGESDGLPGLIVDRFGDVLVMQALSWGIEAHRTTLLELLMALTGVATVFERSDADVRGLEGLPERVELLAGASLPEALTIEEHGLRFGLDLLKGHKTGFYLDQRANRKKVQELSAGRHVLDAFCYTGGFGIHALAGAAQRVTFLDSSQSALSGLEANLELNGFGRAQQELIAADAFTELRKFRDQGRQFDLIVLDPPKFVPRRRRPPVGTRTSTFWRSSCFGREGFWPRFPAQAVWMPVCSRRSSPGRRWMPGFRCRYAAGSGRIGITPWIRTSRKAVT